MRNICKGTSKKQEVGPFSMFTFTVVMIVQHAEKKRDDLNTNSALSIATYGN